MSSSTKNKSSSSGGGAGSSVSTEVFSVSSSYRHHNAGPFMPLSSSQSSSSVVSASNLSVNSSGLGACAILEDLKPKPVLVKDSNHKPKTTGSFGLMIVGLGGANGTTLLAGILANRLNINWRGPRGELMKPNYYGCITQLNSKGGGVGFKDRIRGLADTSMAAVGGWVSMNRSLLRF
jgi:Myo-inositol-1-phosphate synthase